MSALSEEELSKACEQWTKGSTEPPEWDSPLHGVFQAGISYTLNLVGSAVGATSWEGGDGTETIEGDVHVEVMNIMKAAGMFDDDDGAFATLAEIRRLRAALAERDAAIDDLLVCFVGPTFEMHLRLQAVIDKHNLDPRAAKARASLAAELKEKQG